MESGINYDKRQSRTKDFFIWLIAGFVFFSTYFYVPPEYSDLGRYYELIESLFSLNNIFYGVMLVQEENIDFIYVLFMLGALKLGIKLQFATALICSIYWVIISKIFFKPFKNVTALVVVAFLGVVCFPNMMYVISTARNVLAFVFLFAGFQSWSNNKKAISVFCLILSVLTHFTCIMYIALSAFVSFAYKLWLVKHPRLVNALCFFLPVLTYFAGAVLVNGLFMSSTMQDLFGSSAGYGSYVSHEVEAITYDFIGIGEKAFLMSHIFVLYVLLNIDRRNSYMRVMVLIYYSVITMSFACSYNLLVRFILCIAYFYSLYISDCITHILDYPVRMRSVMKLISLLFMFIFAWNFHGLIMKYWQF